MREDTIRIWGLSGTHIPSATSEIVNETISKILEFELSLIPRKNLCISQPTAEEIPVPSFEDPRDIWI